MLPAWQVRGAHVRGHVEWARVNKINKTGTGDYGYMRFAIRWLATSFLVLSLPAAAGAAERMPAADMFKLAGRSTFEVVLPKVEPENVKYEKPLPFELLTYTERNDKYWSIGTAFAIGGNMYVSAAHVLQSGLGSGMGRPSLRNAAGEVFPVERVLKHSVHEDYIVFSVRGAPPAEPVTVNTEPAIGAQVFAVGNALGEGVVIRDGLLTSQTPEDQDGRWKWLRFSAAASPGNSGGPLLDENGRVIGLITAKSPNENLNYALPISEVMKGRTDASVAEFRTSFALPILRAQRVTEVKTQFPLPADWQAFTLQSMRREHQMYLDAQRDLLKQEDDKIMPKGDFARLAATLDADVVYGLVTQQDDDSWGYEKSGGEEETELPDDGTLWLDRHGDAALFRLRRSGKQADVAFYHDGAALMDQLLRGLKFPRIVGQQAIRITSLGAPSSDALLHDRFGRVWQEHTWGLGYGDMQIICMALPTPEGYVGLLHFSTALSSESVREKLRLMADYTHVAYVGSVRQWQSFLGVKDLAPDMLRNTGLRNDAKDGLVLKVPAFQVRIPDSVIKVEADSKIRLLMAFASRDNKLVWEPLGLSVFGEAADSSFIQILGQPRPTKGAGTKLNDRWTKLSAKQGEYLGEPQHTPQFDKFWTRSVVGDPSGDRLFEVIMTLNEKTLVPRQVAERRDQLLSGIKPGGVSP
jgi:serine protease Do